MIFKIISKLRSCPHFIPLYSLLRSQCEVEPYIACTFISSLNNYLIKEIYVSYLIKWNLQNIKSTTCHENCHQWKLCTLYLWLTRLLNNRKTTPKHGKGDIQYHTYCTEFIIVSNEEILGLRKVLSFPALRTKLHITFRGILNNFHHWKLTPFFTVYKL